MRADLGTGGFGTQAIAVAGSLLTAVLVARWPRSALRRQSPPRPTAPLARALAMRLRPVLTPALWLLLLWFSLVALREAQVPVRLVEAVIGLVLAWVGVRLAVSLVASVFWSRVIAFCFVVPAALKLAGLWSATLYVFDEMAVTIGAVRLSVLGVAEATLILGLLCWAALFAARRLDGWLARLPGLTPSGRVLFGKVFRFTGLSIAAIVALHAIGIDLTSLAVFSGAVGLGIGFGLQKVFSNLISGMILLLDRSVKPGDVIAVGDHYGWIDALGARYVSVVTRDGIEHLIPNEDLITNCVENWSHSNNLLRLRVPFGVAYGTDVARAVDLAEDVARGVPRVLHDPPPSCLLMSFGDSAIELELRVWIQDPRNGVHNVRSRILMRLWEAFRHAGIEIPFAQRDLHLKTAAVLPVRLVETEPRPGA